MVDVRTNLLKNRQTLSEKDYQRERLILRYSIVGITIVVVVAVALSIWTLVLTRRLSTIEKSIAEATKEMQGLVQASAQQVYLKSRLKLVTGFLGNRSIMREALQKILTITIPGTHISGIVFEDEMTISLSYFANSAVVLDDLLKYFQTDTEYFTQVVNRGLSRSKDGSYQMNLALTIPKGSK